jgi:hypothetical protein
MNGTEEGDEQKQEGGRPHSQRSMRTDADEIIARERLLGHIP